MKHASNINTTRPPKNSKLDQSARSTVVGRGTESEPFSHNTQLGKQGTAMSPAHNTVESNTLQRTGNEIDDEGAGALGEALMVNTSLITLKLNRKPSLVNNHPACL